MEYKKISDICYINPENITKNYSKDYINYLDTSNLTKNKIDNIVKIKLSDAPSRAKRIVKIGDILYSTVRPNLCHYGTVQDTLNDTLIVSTGYVVLRAKENINPIYVYINITLPEITEKLHSIASSAVSAYPSIKPSDLGDIVIPVPDKSIQDKIANKYLSIYNKISNNELMMNDLEHIAKTVFDSYFIDTDNNLNNENSAGWKHGKLSDLCSFTNGYAFKSKDLKKEPSEGCYKVFKQGNIKTTGGINHEATKSYIDSSISKKMSEKYLLKTGDILMCMTDMKDNVVLLGHTAFMDCDDEYYVNQRVGLLRAKENIHYGYLYLLTNSTGFLNSLRSKANSGVQVNLSKEAIEDTPVMIAPDYVYKKFNSIIEPIFNKLCLLSRENIELTNLLEIMMKEELNKLGSE